MVEPSGGLVAAMKARVAGDLAPCVVDHDLVGADPSGDAQTDQGDRHRVAVLPDRDQRLAVDARARPLARVVVAGRQLPQQARLDPERLPDRLGAAADPPLEVGEAAILEQVVELLERGDLGDRDEVRAAEAADFAFHAALLVGARAAGASERRLVQVVRTQTDETVLLDPPSAAQHLLDRRAQVVVADRRERAAEEAERLHVRRQERLLRLPLERDHERRAHTPEAARAGCRWGRSRRHAGRRRPPQPGSTVQRSSALRWVRRSSSNVIRRMRALPSPRA